MAFLISFGIFPNGFAKSGDTVGNGIMGLLSEMFIRTILKKFASFIMMAVTTLVKHQSATTDKQPDLYSSFFLRRSDSY